MPAPERAVSRSTTVVLTALVLTTLLASGRARAADVGSAPDTSAGGGAPSAAKLNEEGFAFFKERDFRRAVEKFLQAYALEPDVNLLFNIARCYDQLGDTAAASEKYRLFIASREADPEGKRRAQEALRALEQRQQAQAAAPPEPAASAPVPAAAPAAPAAAPVVVVQAPTAPPPPETRSGRTGRIALMGAGIVGVFVGSTLLILGKQDYDQVRNSANFGNANGVDPMTEPQARSLLDSGQNKQIVGSVVLGVGVVATITSIVLMSRASSAAPAEHRMAIGVAPEQGGANLLLQGRF